MGRHIIINVQPGDQAIDTAVKRLATKPISKQWKERWAIPLTGIKGVAFDAEDKVYLVGHGGSGNTAGDLGGMNPTVLAAAVTTPLMNVGQINLVMCGSGDPTLSGAKVFKDILEMFGCGAELYAYPFDLKVNDDGKKYVEFGGVTGLGVGLGAAGLVRAGEVKREVKLDDPPQVAPPEDDDERIL
jgi:hypothetical protein